MRFCGICIPTYIEHETRLGINLSTCSWEKYRSEKMIEMISVEGTEVPSWRWTINRESEAYEVLEEFKNFGPGAFRWYTFGANAAAYHSQWKMVCAPEWNFPFIMTPIRANWRHDPSYQVAANLAMARFDRRQAKKIAKRDGFKNWKKKTVMPGSWIES